MDTEILYEEIQLFDKRSTQTLLKVIIGVLFIFSLVTLFTATENKLEIFASTLVSAVILTFIDLLFSKAKLITQIKKDGIYVRFPPLQNSFIICTWENIDQLCIKSYNPIAEYGGWGWRIGRNKRAYNVSGNIGIEIIFTDGTKLMIGTNEPEAMANVLMRLGKLDFPES